MTEIEKKNKVSKEAMSAIIVTGTVAIFCSLACTRVALALILNAPW